MPTLECYLLRKDGQWYEMGNHHHWRSTFAAFPGETDGSVMLGPEDVPLLAIRLDGYGYEAAVLEQLAADIVRWANEGKNPKGVWIDDVRGSFKFVTELCPEVEPGVKPSPITGSIFRLLPGP